MDWLPCFDLIKSVGSTMSCLIFSIIPLPRMVGHYDESYAWWVALFRGCPEHPCVYVRILKGFLILESYRVCVEVLARYSHALQDF
jgi:hypothetical protein